jgi:hypothetical protein
VQRANRKGRIEGPPRRYRQIKISVIGKKSRKTISIPVWYASALLFEHRWASY